MQGYDAYVYKSLMRLSAQSFYQIFKGAHDPTTDEEALRETGRDSQHQNFRELWH